MYIYYIYECMLITFFLKVTEVIILNSDLLLEIIRTTNYFYFCFNGFVLKYHLQAINTCEMDLQSTEMNHFRHLDIANTNCVF